LKNGEEKKNTNAAAIRIPAGYQAGKRDINSPSEWLQNNTVM
jgi:hypothetical protein